MNVNGADTYRLPFVIGLRKEKELLLVTIVDKLVKQIGIKCNDRVEN